MSRSEGLIVNQTNRGFNDSEDLLRAELEYLELLLKREILITIAGSAARPTFHEFSGTYISEEEIAGFLEDDHDGSSEHEVEPNGRCEQLSRRLAELRATIDGRVDTSVKQGVDLRLPTLLDRFDLTPAERQILLCCLAPDLDVRFQRYFAYLQNDVTCRRPTLQLLRQIGPDTGAGLRETRELFGPSSKLRRRRLLEAVREPVDNEGSFPTSQLTVPDCVLDYLVGVDRVDARLVGFTRLLPPAPIESYSSYHRHHEGILSRLFAQFRQQRKLPLSYIAGPKGSGRAAVVEALADLMGRQVLEVRCSDAVLSRTEPGEAMEVLARDALLHDCLIHFRDFDDVTELTEESKRWMTAMRRFFTRDDVPDSVLTGLRESAEVAGGLELPLQGLAIPYPLIEERYEIWNRFLECSSAEEGDRLISRLAGKFRFTPGQVLSVVQSVSHLPAPEDGETPPITLDVLYRQCREESNQGLLRYSQKTVPKYNWDDIVLPADTRAQLKEIRNSIENRHTVCALWGFDARFSLGKGINVLFSGESGTGKTMAAEIIAGDLGLDLFKIDLSCVVSKYIGETERNLSKIFQEAETANCILFFDEADALFGKRSAVKDAHDRYANIEINYLLQKMDEFEGIVILATNLKANLDPAFMRRLNHAVEFPFPDEEFRQRIWAKMFPQDTPVDDQLDFDFMARKFRLAGGNIRNIALNSAYMAASDGGCVTMECLILAVKREYQKIGRLCSRSEFGQYYRLVEK